MIARTMKSFDIAAAYLTEVEMGRTSPVQATRVIARRIARRIRALLVNDPIQRTGNLESRKLIPLRPAA